MNDIQKEKIQKVLSYYGFEIEREQFVEEMAEAIFAIQKHKRYGTLDTWANLKEEIADVLITATCMKMFVGEDAINKIIDEKLTRQEKRIAFMEGDIHEQP